MTSPSVPAFILLKLFSNGNGVIYTYKYLKDAEKPVNLDKREFTKRPKQ